MIFHCRFMPLIAPVVTKFGNVSRFKKPITLTPPSSKLWSCLESECHAHHLLKLILTFWSSFSLPPKIRIDIDEKRANQCGYHQSGFWIWSTEIALASSIICSIRAITHFLLFFFCPSRKGSESRMNICSFTKISLPAGCSSNSSSCNCSTNCSSS